MRIGDLDRVAKLATELESKQSLLAKLNSGSAPYVKVDQWEIVLTPDALGSIAQHIREEVTARVAELRALLTSLGVDV